MVRYTRGARVTAFAAWLVAMAAATPSLASNLYGLKSEFQFVGNIVG